MPSEVLERERPREVLGQARLLVDLDDAPRAHHAQVGPVRAHPALGVGGIGIDDEDGVARANRRLGADGERVAEAVPHRSPLLSRVGRVEGQLARAARRRIAVDGDARRVRAAARHLDEHRGEVVAEALLDLGRLREEADDSAHVVSISTSDRR